MFFTATDDVSLLMVLPKWHAWRGLLPACQLIIALPNTVTMVTSLYAQCKTLQGSSEQTLVPAKTFLQFCLELFHIISPRFFSPPTVIFLIWLRIECMFPGFAFQGASSWDEALQLLELCHTSFPGPLSDTLIIYITKGSKNKKRENL